MLDGMDARARLSITHHVPDYSESWEYPEVVIYSRTITRHGSTPHKVEVTLPVSV
jgi:hypothetical protein